MVKDESKKISNDNESLKRLLACKKEERQNTLKKKEDMLYKQNNKFFKNWRH